MPRSLHGRITVLSGKGGAGKTTIALGLAQSLHALGHQVTLVDADAEAPDAALGLTVRWERSQIVSQSVPAVEAGRCDGCGDCAAACRFNALAMAGGRPLLFAELCHGCGACALACPARAIREEPHPLGTVRQGRTAWGRLVEARTAVGSARASRVIATALTEAGHGLVVIDGPPGSACSAVAAVAEARVAVLVVEATPFGRQDASHVAELLHQRGITTLVAANRMSDDELETTRTWCAERNLPLAAIIPEDRDLDRAGATGEDPWQASPVLATACRNLACRIADAW
jgi:MinD superfamily P-loop ATPase